MYNNRHGCRDNWRKEYVASNQVVGGSNLSGCAKVINDLARFRKLNCPTKRQTSNKNKNSKVLKVYVFEVAGKFYK